MLSYQIKVSIKKLRVCWSRDYAKSPPQISTDRTAAPRGFCRRRELISPSVVVCANPGNCHPEEAATYFLFLRPTTPRDKNYICRPDRRTTPRRAAVITLTIVTLMHNALI